jgi:hypothetical protein
LPDPGDGAGQILDDLVPNDHEPFQFRGVERGRRGEKPREPLDHAGAVITSVTGTCSDVEHFTSTASAAALIIQVEATAIATDTAYSVKQAAGPYTADVQFVPVDASCQKLVQPLYAVDGSVTFTALGPTIVAGRFDVTFWTGDHVTGEFSGSICTFDRSALGGITPGVCNH